MTRCEAALYWAQHMLGPDPGGWGIVKRDVSDLGLHDRDENMPVAHILLRKIGSHDPLGLPVTVGHRGSRFPQQSQIGSATGIGCNHRLKLRIGQQRIAFKPIIVHPHCLSLRRRFLYGGNRRRTGSLGWETFPSFLFDLLLWLLL